MSMLRVTAVVDNWFECRKKTISSLRGSASELRASHQGNAKAEHGCASGSLFGDLVGFGGLFLAPVSGGLSLGVFGVSVLAGLGAYISKRDANSKDKSVTRKVNRDVEQALEDDETATGHLIEILQHFSDLENKIEAMQIGDIEFESRQLSDQMRNNDSPISKLGNSTHTAYLKAVMTCAEKVMITKDVCRGTRPIREVVSTEKSVNHIYQTAKSLSTTNEATVMSLQGSQSVAKSTTAFASISRGADGIKKNAGVVSSAVKSGRVAVEVVTASGQAASTAKTVTKAVNAGTAISTATKGADTTIKTVKSIKQASDTVKTISQVASDTDKAIRSSRITTSAARFSKVSETATKAASISKVGLAINVVVIPLGIYHFYVASKNLSMSHEDVEYIETTANDLEHKMENAEGIYEYLQIMEEKLHSLLKVLLTSSEA